MNARRGIWLILNGKDFTVVLEFADSFWRKACTINGSAFRLRSDAAKRDDAPTPILATNCRYLKANDRLVLDQKLSVDPPFPRRHSGLDPIYCRRTQLLSQFIRALCGTRLRPSCEHGSEREQNRQKSQNGGSEGNLPLSERVDPSPHIHACFLAVWRLGMSVAGRVTAPGNTPKLAAVTCNAYAPICPPAPMQGVFH